MPDDGKKGDGHDHPAEDFFIPGPELEGGAGRIALHHTADHGLEPAFMYPMRDGVPMPDGALIVRRREGENVYEAVDTVKNMREAPKGGPARVNSRAYCDGHDRIFKPSRDAN